MVIITQQSYRMLQQPQDRFIQEIFIFEKEMSKIPRRGSVIIANQCRICLQEDQEEIPGAMISPCLCSGSVKYVHFNCMCKWIERNSNHSLSNIRKIGVYQCEMCKYKIQFECSRETQVRDWVRFKQRASSYGLTFFLLSIIIFVCLGIVILGFCLLANPQVFRLSGDLLFQSITILVAVILMLVLSCFAVYKWVLHFLMTVSTKIVKINPPRPESPRKKQQSSRLCLLKTDSSSPNHKSLMQTKLSTLTMTMTGLDMSALDTLS